ncbi:MAG: hypothetical protein DME24_20245 [Verrucomicrobia bacterium]|nr:MAG: hypothetical protein DME24_20245 [Verrucomicrobiota bacterium]
MSAALALQRQRVLSFARWFVLLWAMVFCGSRLRSAPYQAPGTKQMAERLQKISAQSNLRNNLYLNRERADLFGKELNQLLTTPDSPDKGTKVLDLDSRYATELLLAGKSWEAIEEFTRLDAFTRTSGVNFGSQTRSSLRHYLVIAYLRLGEQENCLTNHTIDSCLMPIQAAGIHKIQRGSRKAVEFLIEQLNEFPDDLKARWLLNLAYMTLGEYPDHVPSKWLIPPRAFESDYPLSRFYDVAGNLGLDLNSLSGGVIAEDFDGDGNLDIMISSLGVHDQLRYIHNNGDGTFTERTEDAGLLGETGGLNIMQTDYNNDGWPDVLVLRGAWFGVEGHYPLSLLRNNGNGTFDDVTEEAGLLRFHPTQAATWFDYNNDGWLDLFVGNETTPGDTNRCELFHNNGDGTFTECAAQVGLDAIAFIKAVASGDYNNDGWPDLYVSSRGQPKMLFRNEGPQSADRSPKGAWKFTDVAAQAGVTEPRYSFPTWFFDYDNDGWLDIFVAGFGIKDVGDIAADYLGLPTKAERARLYHNNHDGTFTDVTKAAHLYKVLLGMACNFGDLDNDGYLDFYLGTGDPDLSTLIPNRMFRNAEGKFFQDVTAAGGFGHLQKGHGIAFADIDNDGDQDIFANMGGAYSGDIYRKALFENPGNSNHWLKLKLVGVKSNRAGIGARIKVTVENGAGQRAIYKTVNSGGSFGANPLRQEIGLGQAKSISSVEVFWPASHTTQTLKQINPDSCYTIREGDPQPVLVKLKSFKLAAGSHSHHTHEH